MARKKRSPKQSKRLQKELGAMRKRLDAMIAQAKRTEKQVEKLYAKQKQVLRARQAQAKKALAKLSRRSAAATPPIKAGVQRAVLSNGAPAMLDAVVKSGGLSDLLDDVLSVEAAGIFKPAPAVYQLACDRFDCAPRDICFLSSNAWDAAGAAHFGFRVVWVNRFGQVRERLPGRPLREIRSLEPLPALLGAA